MQRLKSVTCSWWPQLVVGLALATVVGCRDAMPTTSALKPAGANLSADPALVDSIDFFAADVKVTTSGRHAGKALPSQRREFRYRVERTLVGASWKTTMTIPENGVGPVRPGKTDIARVELDEVARTARTYGRDGQEIPLPDVDDPRVVDMARKYGSDSGYQRLRSMRMPSQPSASQHSARGWLDALVVPATEEQRGRRRDAV